MSGQPYRSFSSDTPSRLIRVCLEIAPGIRLSCIIRLLELQTLSVVSFMVIFSLILLTICTGRIVKVTSILNKFPNTCKVTLNNSAIDSLAHHKWPFCLMCAPSSLRGREFEMLIKSCRRYRRHCHRHRRRRLKCRSRSW